MFRRARFALLDGEPVSLAGFTDGTTWNGWARPRFTREAADALVELWKRGYPVGNGLHAEYDGATDSYVFAAEGTSNRAEWDAFPGEDIVVEGQRVHVYAIGAGCWTWEEVSWCQQ